MPATIETGDEKSPNPKRLRYRFQSGLNALACEKVLLKARQECFPGRGLQRLRHRMSESADDHCRLPDLLWVTGFNNVNYVETSQCCITILPFNSRAFAPNLCRHSLSPFFKTFG